MSCAHYRRCSLFKHNRACVRCKHAIFRGISPFLLCFTVYVSYIYNYIGDFALPFSPPLSSSSFLFSTVDVSFVSRLFFPPPSHHDLYIYNMCVYIVYIRRLCRVALEVSGNGDSASGVHRFMEFVRDARAQDVFSWRE